MNKRALILVILFAAVSLSACANNPASTADSTGAEVEASTATTAESGDTKETEGMTGSTPPASSFEPVTEVPTESAEAESAASPNTAAPESSEKPATEASRPTAAESPAKTEKPQETTPPGSTPSEPASEPETPPQRTEEPSKPTPEPTTPAFDVSGYVSFAKNYAQSIGLSLDSTATGCWDTPIEAHAGCIYLERDIRDRLDWYLDSGFTAIWVWSVDLGGGNHEIFIGYA